MLLACCTSHDAVIAGNSPISPQTRFLLAPQFAPKGLGQNDRNNFIFLFLLDTKSLTISLFKSIHESIPVTYTSFSQWQLSTVSLLQPLFYSCDLAAWSRHSDDISLHFLLHQSAVILTASTLSSFLRRSTRATAPVLFSLFHRLAAVDYTI